MPRFCLLLIAFACGCSADPPADQSADLSAGLPTESEPRNEVLFWHFWGGRDRPVVDEIVRRFNASQSTHRVRAVAMPGANLDLKFFLSVAGGDPPDLLNQDDPIVADWAHRGALVPLDEMATDEELVRLTEWLFPAARQLGEYDGRLYALANGLDLRALYINKTLLDERGLSLPETTDDLDRLAVAIAPPAAGRLDRVGYLPDARRLWAWGIVFGGRFYDPAAIDPADAITADSPPVLAALRWMAEPSRRYGPDRVAAFRTGDQGLTGAAFPLLADRRYAAIMDGQWRVRDLVEAEETARRRGEPFDEIVVTPLPAPPGGRERAGWVNGNFFVVPRGGKNPAGAWEFMKFWSGFDGNEPAAAEACVAGGWVPASQHVVDQPAFEAFLAERPRFRTFVELAASENQHPTPPLPVAPLYVREVNAAVQDVLYRGAEPAARLKQAADRVRQRLRETMPVGVIPVGAGGRRGAKQDG
ncbi:MAG: extracellular solute-binding protein, partial [Planctomycetota bacterium]